MIEINKYNYRKYLILHHKSKKHSLFICTICNKMFFGLSYQKRCSDACRKIHINNEVKRCLSVKRHRAKRINKLKALSFQEEKYKLWLEENDIQDITLARETGLN